MLDDYDGYIMIMMVSSEQWVPTTKPKTILMAITIDMVQINFLWDTNLSTHHHCLHWRRDSSKKLSQWYLCSAATADFESAEKNIIFFEKLEGIVLELSWAFCKINDLRVSSLFMTLMIQVIGRSLKLSRWAREAHETCDMDDGSSTTSNDYLSLKENSSKRHITTK